MGSTTDKEGGPLAPGAILGAYVLERCVRREEEAEVWVGRRSPRSSPVLLEILDGEIDEPTRVRFLERMRALVAVRHPNLVRVFSAQAVGLRTFAVTERVVGADLETLLVRDGPLPVAGAAAVASDLLGGLRHLHRGGLAHGRVGPSHILIDRDGRCRLRGFSSASSRANEDLVSTLSLIFSLVSGGLWEDLPRSSRETATDGQELVRKELRAAIRPFIADPVPSRDHVARLEQLFQRVASQHGGRVRLRSLVARTLAEEEPELLRFEAPSEDSTPTHQTIQIGPASRPSDEGQSFDEVSTLDFGEDEHEMLRAAEPTYSDLEAPAEEDSGASILDASTLEEEVDDALSVPTLGSEHQLGVVPSPELPSLETATEVDTESPFGSDDEPSTISVLEPEDREPDHRGPGASESRPPDSARQGSLRAPLADETVPVHLPGKPLEDVTPIAGSPAVSGDPTQREGNTPSDRMARFERLRVPSRSEIDEAIQGVPTLALERNSLPVENGPTLPPASAKSEGPLRRLVERSRAADPALPEERFERGEATAEYQHPSAGARARGDDPTSPRPAADAKDVTLLGLLALMLAVMAAVLAALLITG